jgi:hypothetical protein
MTKNQKNGTKIRHFQNLASRFAQKNIYRILNLSKTSSHQVAPFFKMKFLSKEFFFDK